MKESSLKFIPIRRERRPCIGGLVPFSTVDWPDHLAATVFVSGCPWRCHYCHNPHLQPREKQLSWETVTSFLRSRQGLLDAVVISGGEPLMDVTLPDMVHDIRALGFEIGLHTVGIYPDRLEPLLPDLNWIGLDIKTLPGQYDELTGRAGSWKPVSSCLRMLQHWSEQTGRQYECRTTWSESGLGQPALLDLAEMLKERGVTSYAVQRLRSTPDTEPTDCISPRTAATLQSMFTTFTIR